MPVYPASHKMAHNEPSTLSTRHSGKMLTRELVCLGSNSKLVVSGNNALCSGRKNLLACSSVLKAFTKARERERVTRHEHVFIASRRQDKLQNFGGIASFWDSFKWKKGFSSIFFYDRYIIISVQIMRGYCLCAIIHVHYWVDFVKYVTPLRIWY